MAQNYSSIVSAVANLAVVPVTDTNYQALIPNMFDDAELRLQRDLDLLDNSGRDSSAVLALGTRNFTLPTTNGTFIVVEQLNVLTPAGSTNPETCTRNPLTPASIDSMDRLWPSSTGSTVPTVWAMMDQDLVIVAPFPDQAYNVEVVGTQRFVSLAVSQTTSPLSQFFPDLLISACMVFISAYQRQFGAAVDDPKMAVTWEGHYQTQLKSAQTEESRKKYLVGDTGAAPQMPKGG